MKFTKTMLMNILVEYNGEIVSVDSEVEVKRFPFTFFELKKRLSVQRAYAEGIGFRTIDMKRNSLTAVKDNGDFITVLYIN